VTVPLFVWLPLLVVGIVCLVAGACLEARGQRDEEPYPRVPAPGTVEEWPTIRE
jgi:hypothetical protein